MKKILLVLIIALLIAVIYFIFGKQAEPIANNTQSFSQLKPGAHQVRVDKLQMVDSSRGIDANGDFKGTAERAFDVFVWTPAVKPASPQPLVIYSHGFMSDGEGGNYLGEHLASHGYTVAAATYPLTHYGAPGGAYSGDVVNQPADVSFIIDTLLQKNTDSSSDYYQRIDTSRIAAIGMSLGGMTTEIAAYHPLNADNRIAAAVSIAGPAYMFSKRFFDGRSIPFMMVATSQDALVSYPHNAANILEKIDGSLLVTIENASHTGFSSKASWLRFMDNADSLGCDAVMDNVDMEQQDDWYDQLGSEDIGVLPVMDPPAMCTTNPLPKAMNPLRQHQLNTLAVGSFLRCHFSSEPDVASDNCHFLKSTFAQEIPEVSVKFD